MCSTYSVMHIFFIRVCFVELSDFLDFSLIIVTFSFSLGILFKIIYFSFNFASLLCYNSSLDYFVFLYGFIKAFELFYFVWVYYFQNLKLVILMIFFIIKVLLFVLSFSLLLWLLPFLFYLIFCLLLRHVIVRWL